MEVVLLSTFCYCKFEEEIVHVFWAKRKKAKTVVTFILCFIYSLKPYSFPISAKRLKRTMKFEIFSEGANGCGPSFKVSD